MRRRALLVLEDGTALEGQAFGAEGTAFGEVVFNTAMTGYQEVLTDPSYTRQIVVMTSVHQGNYGVAEGDAESAALHPAGFVVRDASRIASNHRASATLPATLAEAGVVGIAEVDTRLLTRRIRERGALRGAVSSEVLDAEALLAAVREQPEMTGSDLATPVTTPEPYAVPATARPSRGGDPYRVVCLDFGLKRNQLRLLAAHGCDVTVVPATTSAEEILARRPDGLFCSNGPGDPAAVLGPIRAIRDVVAAGVPTFGICLGHQLLGLAAGVRSYKLPFGHHGINQPVRHLARGTIEIASHNHGFALDAGTLPGPEGRLGAVAATHVNLNDGTNAGIALAERPAFSVQYHPEAAPGPHDSRYLFDDFAALMAAARAGEER
ncbi:MAG: glutamine-hydrolyzing carbamoyl-phosphate synthase small subunit [Egibacteraceae bacterium]